MRKWTKTAGILLMAASATYSGRWIVAATADAKSQATSVKPLEDGSDPFASAPTTQPAPQPAKPAAGTSVTSTQVNVSDTGTVEIHVNDANLVEVLRMLSLQSQKNIIASKDVRGTVTANLYDVTVKEALDAILHANGYDYRQKGNFIYVYTTKELQEMEKAQQVKKTEVFRLFYTPAVNAVNLLKPVLSADAQVALTTPAKVGIDADAKTTGGDDHAGNDIIVVTDYPENLDKARRLLKEIDRRPQQVLVEATILVTTLNENNALGVDFTMMGGVDFSTLSSVASSGTTGAAGGTGGSTGSTGSTGSSGTGVAETGTQSALDGTIRNNPAAANVVNQGYTATRLGGSGLTFGVVTHNISLFVTALESVTDTTVLANPKLLVLNKQKGEVHIGKELGYKTSITTDTLTASSVQFLETGTRLVFRPYVGDNGYIRLEIHPEDSDGQVDPTSGVPSKTTTDVTTNVQVKDGHTVVIGGLFRDSTQRQRSQVPFLGDLPGVGPLFRQQTDTTLRQEVIILLTPHIVKDLDQYSASSDEEAKAAERMRVGARRGLMPWGRERLAESWYEGAVKEMGKPNPNRDAALWDLNCAIDLNPMFSEAMELRAQISGKEVTATDDSSIHSFLRRQVMADRASGLMQQTPPATVSLDGPAATQTENKGAAPDPKPQQTQGPAGNDPAATQQTAQAPADDRSATTQPAQASNDDDDARLGNPTTEPGQGSATATTDSPDDQVEDVPAGADDNK